MTDNSLNGRERVKDRTWLASISARLHLGIQKYTVYWLWRYMPHPPLGSTQGRPLLTLRVTSARPQTVTKQPLSRGEDQNQNDSTIQLSWFLFRLWSSRISTDPARHISSHSNQWQSHQGRNQWLRIPVKESYKEKEHLEMIGFYALLKCLWCYCARLWSARHYFFLKCACLFNHLNHVKLLNKKRY